MGDTKTDETKMDENYKYLRAFSADIKCLDPIKKRADKFNIYIRLYAIKASASERAAHTAKNMT